MSAESVLLYLSSEHAYTRSGSKFQFHVGNTIYVEKAVKIVPVSIHLANIFPNVNQYRNSWTEVTAHTITEKQYSSSELVTALNTESPKFTFSVDVNGFFVITCVGTETLSSPTIDFFEMLGFQDQVTAPNYTLSVTTSLTASTLPNLGGEKIVFFLCDELSPSNCVYAKDGSPYNVLSMISLHDVDYGHEGHFRGADVFVDDIEYKHHNNLDSFVIQLIDSKFRALPLPNNYHFRIVFKVFHEDNIKRQKI